MPNTLATPKRLPYAPLNIWAPAQTTSASSLHWQGEAGQQGCLLALQSAFLASLHECTKEWQVQPLVLVDGSQGGGTLLCMEGCRGAAHAQGLLELRTVVDAGYEAAHAALTGRPKPAATM